MGQAPALCAVLSFAPGFVPEQSNHVFHSKEAEVITLIADFMQRHGLVEHGPNTFPHR